MFAASSIAALVFIVVAASAPVRAADPDEPGLLDKAERLQQEARDLKAEGKHERAEMLMRQAEELRARAEKQKRQLKSGESAQPRPEELRRQLARARTELDELRAAGKPEEALKVQRHIQELQLAMDRFRDSSPDRFQPRRKAWSPQPVAPGQPDMQRLRHLEAAIGNLHAAGLHEPAEQLAREAQAMRQSSAPGRNGPETPDRLSQEIERLRREVQELQQAVRELRARLDEQTRERR
jgi:predicted RNase H-like nuclease (RuvC/YqgF family)